MSSTKPTPRERLAKLGAAFAMFRNGKSIAGLTILGIFVLVAIFAEQLAPYSPTQINPQARLQPPSAAHWLGTTHLGEDVLSQVIYGTRGVVIVGALTALISMVIAIVVGVLAGYLSGWRSEALSALANVFLVIPSIPILIIIASRFTNPPLWMIALILGLLGWGWGARVLRAQTMSLRNRDFIQAAKLNGEPLHRIIGVEMLPNLMAIIASSFVGAVTSAILGLTTLSYIGVIPVNAYNWGTILNWASAQGAFVQNQWWWFLPPGLCIAAIGVALALLNFGIDEYINPRLRSAGERARAMKKKGLDVTNAVTVVRAPPDIDGDILTMDPYLNPELPVADRVADLLGRMTVEEKVGQMMQLDAREGVREHILDKHVGSILHTSPERVREAHDLTAQTRLRIPLLVGEDVIHGHSFYEGATIFPTQLGMAASWDADLMERMARATAVEASATGMHWTFSPVLCISRDLRWGRVNETFGEDPFLIGELASAMVRGYQGSGLTDETAILATAKHFAGYSETQGGRDASEADISRRKLRSWFLPPFERVAREGCRTFMLGYQTTDGVPITVNDWLLTDVLRGEWGYTGMLITDWDNVGRMVWEQKVQPDITHAAAAAVKAGNDMVMTTPTFYEGALDAIERGLLEESDLDAAVARILTLKFELGLFENPRRPSDDRIAEVIGSHADLNLEVARRSLVLLENNGALPLAADRPTRVAVVGPLADDAQTQLGDWAGSSGQVDWLPDGHPREMITTVLDGLREVAPRGSEVTFVRGADILELVPNPAGETFPDGQPRPPVVAPAPVDDAELAAAVAAAEASDVVVAVVGDRIELVGEGRSTATLDLLGGQIALLDAVIATGKPVVVVLLASKPLVLPPSVADAAAIIWAANPGMQGGRALAEIVFGHTEPSGRLPISFARHVGQQPTYYNQIRGQHGDRYADLTQSPAWAFGEGRSYTTIEYSDLVVTTPDVSATDTVRARVTLTNTGARPALETVQVYVSDVVTSVSWADKELKGYRQVEVAPGETVTVDVEIAVSDCTIVDAEGHRVVEPGAFELLVGPSSRDEALLRAGFTVK